MSLLDNDRQNEGVVLSSVLKCVNILLTTLGSLTGPLVHGRHNNFWLLAGPLVHGEIQPLVSYWSTTTLPLTVHSSIGSTTVPILGPFTHTFQELCLLSVHWSTERTVFAIPP